MTEPLAEDPAPIASRYRGAGTAVFTAPDGRQIVYLRRRFVPPPERFETVAEVAVAAGDRPDTLAAEHLGDPEASWRLYDANGILRPADLTSTVGRRIRITLPEGFPGAGP